jgi:hypothetical protein
MKLEFFGQICVITTASILLGIHGGAEISKQLRPSNSGFETAPFQNWCSAFKSVATYISVLRASVTPVSTRRIMKSLKNFVITSDRADPALGLQLKQEEMVLYTYIGRYIHRCTHTYVHKHMHIYIYS